MKEVDVHNLVMVIREMYGQMVSVEVAGTMR